MNPSPFGWWLSDGHENTYSEKELLMRQLIHRIQFGADALMPVEEGPTILIGDGVRLMVRYISAWMVAGLPRETLLDLMLWNVAARTAKRKPRRGINPYRLAVLMLYFFDQMSLEGTPESNRSGHATLPMLGSFNVMDDPTKYKALQGKTADFNHLAKDVMETFREFVSDLPPSYGQLMGRKSFHDPAKVEAHKGYVFKDQKKGKV